MVYCAIIKLFILYMCDQTH